MYDPILACYFDPKTNDYYELRDEPSLAASAYGEELPPQAQ